MKGKRSRHQVNLVKKYLDKGFKKPPVTQRLCLSCKVFRPFKYEYVLGHSRCMMCGCPYGSMQRSSEEHLGYNLYDRWVRQEWKKFTGIEQLDDFTKPKRPEIIATCT